MKKRTADPRKLTLTTETLKTLGDPSAARGGLQSVPSLACPSAYVTCNLLSTRCDP